MNSPARSLALACSLLVACSSARAQGNTFLAELPITLIDGYVLLKARVNDSEQLDFLFDTGCTEAVVDSATAARLGLNTRQQSRTSAGGVYLENVVDNARLSFGTLTLEPRRILNRANDLLERRFGVKVDGVVGADLLRDFVIEIDYDRLRLVIHESDAYAYQGRGSQLEISSNSYFSTTNAELLLAGGESLRGRFLIDTGAGVALALNTPFVNEHGLLQSIGAPHIEYRLAAYGVEMLSYPGRVPSFQLGEHGFAEMPVLLSQTLEGPLSPGAIAGIIGNRIWRRFNTVFDYARNAIYLEPNDSFDGRFEVDCSGLGMEREDGGRLVVTAIQKDSPADSAEIQLGDEIVMLNGSPISTGSIRAVRRTLNQPGDTVTLRVLRAGRTLNVTLTLRELY